MQVIPSRCKASTAQLSYLADFMKSHRNMAAGISPTLQGRANLETLWDNLAKKLNSLGGPIKTVAKWKQTWRDLRNNVKRKESHNKKEFRGYGPGSTGNGPPTIKKLSQVEEQVLSIMGPVAVYGMEEVVCTEPIEILPECTGLELPPPPPADQDLQIPPADQDLLLPPPPPDQELIASLIEREIPKSPLLVLPGPSNKHTPSDNKKRRRVVKRHDNFDTKLLQIEEEKLKVKKEKNEILNRMVNILEDISNKLK